MRHAFLLSALLLTGCATNPPPIVDLAGKDPVQANRDMAECHSRPYDHIKFIGPDVIKDRGFPESRCLESMGYNVLSRTQ
jgi:starvation-inducible outer membrane lipoprotein